MTREGHPAGAIETLRTMLSKFTEGFDIPDLVEARALLARLEK